MQEIKKRRILLASVLKPVDDPRMLERMGQSLAARGNEVFIAGFPPASSQQIAGITFLPHSGFNRISLGRIKARFKILTKSLSLKPDILIITTHELIGVALFFKLLTGRKVIYDVQENYYRNILYTSAFPKLLKAPLAWVVRFKETITSWLFFKFILAEKCYLSELPFPKERMIVVENKCASPPGFTRSSHSDSMQLIFTGTIAESTGVFQAISLTKKLNAIDSGVRLEIIGQCFQQSVLDRISDEITGSPFISFTGGMDFVPHQKIFEAIASARFGIVVYPTSPHTKDKMPTKLYEYLACKLPVLLQNNPLWVNLCKASNASIAIDFDNIDEALIISKMKSDKFYVTATPDATWASEEDKFLNALI